MANKNEKMPEATQNGLPVAQGQNALFNLDAFADKKAGKGESVTGLETLNASDMKMPKIKLIQPTSLEATKQKCPAGWFYNTITEEKYEKLPCTMLALGKSRVMWKKPFKRGEEPLCRSIDSVTPAPGGQCKGPCETCAYAKWDNLAESETKPACNMSYTWLGVMDNVNKSPFRMIMPGMSVSPTKDFLNIIAPNRLPPFVYRLELTSEQKENESGVFYVVKYNLVGTINPAEFGKYEDMAISLKDLFSKAVAADIITEAQAEDSAPQHGGMF